LQARAQSRGVVILAIGASALAADLQLRADDDQWVGLGDGHGVATGRRVTVGLGGRRMPQPRRATMWLPNAHGQMSVLSGTELRHQMRAGLDWFVTGECAGDKTRWDAFDSGIPVGVVEEGDRLPA
jgi:hypothetical protein